MCKTERKGRLLAYVFLKFIKFVTWEGFTGRGNEESKARKALSGRDRIVHKADEIWSKWLVHKM